MPLVTIVYRLSLLSFLRVFFLHLGIASVFYDFAFCRSDRVGVCVMLAVCILVVQRPGVY